MSKDHAERWTTEFSIDMETDEWASRRNFLRILSLVSGGFAAANTIAFVRPLLSAQEQAVAAAHGHMAVCHESDLQCGDWRVFSYPDEDHPALLIHRLSGEYIAYTQKCPHLSCPVTYQCGSVEGGEALVCHCHNGHFDIDSGKGVAGPPRELRGLTRIELIHKDSMIFAAGQAAKEKQKDA